MNFFEKTRKLTTDELKSLASLCAGAAFLLVVALGLSGSLRLSLLGNTNQAAAVATYASSGTYTWTAPAGVTQVYVTVVGGGGGGGKGYWTIQACAGDAASGGGGGSGGYVSNQLVSVVPGHTYTITVGSGGAGGSGPCQGGVDGSAGGSSRVVDNSTGATVVSVTGGGGGGGNSVLGGTPGSPGGAAGQNGQIYCGAGVGGNNGSGYGSGGTGGCGGGAGGGGAGGYVSINTSPVFITANPILVSSGGSSVINWTAQSVDANSCSVTGTSAGTILAAATIPFSSNSFFTSGANANNFSWPGRAVFSSDGSKVVMASYGLAGNYAGSVYTSADGGKSWTRLSGTPNAVINGIAASQDLNTVAVAGGNGYVYVSTNGGASWPTQVRVSGWSAVVITSSADGTKLAVGTNGGYIFTSTNSGASWTQQTGSGTHSWQSLASSADGTKLAATAANNLVYLSTDSGASWTPVTLSGASVLTAVAMTPDGTKLAAVDGNGGYIWTSTNGGTGWTKQTGSGAAYWHSVAISSDGTHLAAADNAQYNVGGYMYTSANGGVTWAALNPAVTGGQTWGGIGMSPDGLRIISGSITGSAPLFEQYPGELGWNSTLPNGTTYPSGPVAGSSDLTKLVAGGTDQSSSVNYLYRSTDGGVTWAQTSAPSSYTYSWVLAASSANGSRFYAAQTSGYIYASTDGGSTWSNLSSGLGSRAWSALAASADGTHVAAAVNGGYIWTSTNSGASWTQQTGSGARQWAGLASSADGTKLVADVGNAVFISTNSGATWAQVASNANFDFGAVALSADGSKIAVARTYSGLSISSNGGSTWSTVTPISGGNPLQNVAMSADGTRIGVTALVTIDNGDGTFSYYPLGAFSADGGASWTPVTNALLSGPSVGLAASSDGAKFIVPGGKAVYRYQNDGGNVSGTYNAANLTSTQTYTLSCTLSGAPVSSTATVIVGTPSISIAASPAVISANGTSTLTWSSSVMTPGSCSLSASPATSGTGANTPTTLTQAGTLPAGTPEGINQPLIIGNYVYRFGGYDGTGYTGTIARAPLSNPTSWSVVGAMPASTYGATQFVVGNTIYSFGGINSAGTAWGSSIYTAPVSNPLSWTAAGSLPAAAPASYSDATVIGDTIYFFGGISGGWTNAIYSAPVSNPTAWTQVGTLPAGAPEGGPIGAVVVTGGYVYLFGGYNGSTYTNTIWRAPLSSPTSFTQVGALPGILGYPDVSVINGSIYLMGGYTGTTWVGTTYAASTSNPLSWTSAGTLPATFGAASGSVIIGNTLYIFGGVNASLQNWGNVIYSAPVNTALPLTSYTGQPWFTDGGDNSAVTWPLTQSTTYTLSCTNAVGVPISASAAVSIAAPPVLTLTASSPVGQGQSSTLNWSTSNVNAGSCSVTQIDPTNIVSAAFGMGANDSGTNKSGPALSQSGTYTYKLACTVPYAAGNNGAFTGSPTTGVAGKFGQAVNFAGSGDVMLPASPVSLASGAWTISTWFMAPLPTTSSGWKTLTRGSAGDHEVIVDVNGQLGTYDNINGSGFHVSGYNMTGLSAGWHHLAAVGSGASTGFYIDGAPVGTSTYKSVANVYSIGNYVGGGQQFGTIDDVRVYNRALSSDEVSTLYNGGQITTGLAGYWPFDTNSVSGTTAYDLSGGTTSQTASVTVNNAPPPSSISFNPSTVRVRKGTAATLNWTVNGMASGISCYLLPALAGQPASGLVNSLWNGVQNPWLGSGTTAAITQQGNYTLTCGNGTATTSATAAITLVPSFQEI